MSIEEFDKLYWSAGTKINYGGKLYLVGSICFQEKLLGIFLPGQNPATDPNFSYDWIRCENAELVK